MWGPEQGKKNELRHAAVSLSASQQHKASIASGEFICAMRDDKNEFDGRKEFRRVPALISALICVGFGVWWILYCTIGFTGGVHGHPELKIVFDGRFMLCTWILGLIGAITLPIAVWRWKVRIVWWVYPFMTVTFCVAFLVLVVFCYNKEWFTMRITKDRMYNPWTSTQ